MRELLTARERRALALQSLLSHAAFVAVGPAAVHTIRRVRGHTIEGLEEARRVYRGALSNGRPTLVCANHLTMVDSALLHHALGSIPGYLADFRRFSWNVPAIENFGKNVWLRSLVYLGKGIPIDRAGDSTHHAKVLDRLTYLTANGHVCTIFPEGGRSRTGRIEPTSVTYGVGRILCALERPQVICAYLRGDRQGTYGTLPSKNDVLRISLRVIEPGSAHAGLRAARDMSRQVIETLKELEDRYFVERTFRASTGN